LVLSTKKTTGEREGDADRCIVLSEAQREFAERMSYERGLSLSSFIGQLILDEEWRERRRRKTIGR
jgi:hypothetical protein